MRSVAVLAFSLPPTLLGMVAGCTGGYSEPDGGRLSDGGSPDAAADAPADGPALDAGGSGTFVLGNRLQGGGRSNYDWMKYGSDNVAGARFVPKYSKTIDRLALSWRSTPGYGAGDPAGVYTVQIRTNDSATNFPSSTVLNEITGLNGTSGVDEPLEFDFPDTPVTAGTAYHIVWWNTHSSPSDHYGSANTHMTEEEPWPQGEPPRFEYSEAGTWKLWSSKDNPYNLTGSLANANGSYYPMVWRYTDGSWDGGPYTSAEIAGRQIYGSNMYGEYFTWHQPTATINKVGVSLQRVGSISSSVEYGIVRVSDGQIISEGTVGTSDSFQTAHQSVVEASISPVELQNGETYRLYFKTSGGDSSNFYYQAPTYSFNISNWLDCKAFGADGRLTYDTGGGWSNEYSPVYDFSCWVEGTTP